jgi:uncharacterized radical SAM protein YgiQ
VKKVFVTSGIRFDMAVADEDHGQEYVDCIVKDHVSGQLKIAPEHLSAEVLSRMGKPGPNVLLDFKDMFDASNRRQGKDQFLTYYFMAAHPGCGQRDMEELADFVHRELRTNPEQVQVFTPTPSTVSTLMYCTGKDMDGRRVWSEHVPGLKQKQKQTIVPPSERHGDAKNGRGRPGRR